jgi:hypothetical protein
MIDRQTAAALLDNARVVAGQFIDDGACEDECYVPQGDEFFERGQNRLVLIALARSIHTQVSVRWLNLGSCFGLVICTSSNQIR